jgi:hypothetical protein
MSETTTKRQARRSVHSGAPAVKLGNEKLPESRHDHDVTRPTSVPKESNTNFGRDPMPPGSRK